MVYLITIQLLFSGNIIHYLFNLHPQRPTFAIRDTSEQKMSKDESYSAFYTDDNEFCYQQHGKRICVNPTKIFTSTFESMNATFEKYKKDGTSMTRHDVLCYHYYVLDAYFLDNASEKYIVMLDESEWKFWFIHVSTQLRKLQTSPQWKEDGKEDKHDEIMLDVCCCIFQRKFACQYKFKLFRKSSLQVPTEFFHALASCIDVVRPTIPHIHFVDGFVYLCAIILLLDSDGTMLKMMEKSGLLVHTIRWSTMPLEDMQYTYSFYRMLTREMSLIMKKFKAGQPCGDMVRKILAGKEGHSTPDRKVMNFLRTISQLADMAIASRTLESQTVKMCRFCKTTKCEQWLFCSQCRATSYCSKECQKRDWKSHKPLCQRVPGLKKNLSTFHKILDRFMIDHRDAILLEVHKTGRKVEDLMLEVDFSVDEFGVAPALSDPPQFKVLCMKNAHHYLRKKYPNQNVLKKLESMRRNLDDITESHLLCFGNSYKECCITAMNTGISEAAVLSFLNSQIKSVL